jgi:hypothetical protein
MAVRGCRRWPASARSRARHGIKKDVEGEMEKLVLVCLMVAIICALAEWAPQRRARQ